MILYDKAKGVVEYIAVCVKICLGVIEFQIGMRTLNFVFII